MPTIGLSKPTPQPLDELPAVGSAAPSGPALDALEGRPGVVAFIRHPGCPCAERTVRALGRLSSQTVVVVHGDPEHADSWLASIQAAGALRIVHDPDRVQFARWGLGLTSTRHFLAAAPLLSVIQGWTEGARNRSATGTRYQRAGTFAVDSRRIVRWRQVAAHGGELPDLAAGLSALLVGD